MKDHSTFSQPGPNKSTVTSGQLHKEEVYWTKKLAGESMAGSFPYDCKKTKTQNKMKMFKYQLPEKILLRVIHMSNDSYYRMQMILIAGLVVLLDKYTGNKDIIIGTPTLKQDFEADFINTILPLRSKTGKEDMTFKYLLLQVKQTVIDANEHQNYPIEQLVRQLEPRYSNGDDFSLFDVVIILENIQDKKYIQHLPVNIIFSFQQTNEIIDGTIEYNSLLYYRESIERMSAHFLRILEDVLFNVEIKIAAVDLLTKQEKEQLIFEFNDTFATYPEDKTLPCLCSEQVEKNPDRVGILCGCEQLTYRQLYEKANRLAQALIEKGVKSDTITAAMIFNSLELAIGLLGILLSGGAYLPLDPLYPRERLRYMLQDCRVELVITTTGLPDVLTNIFDGLKTVYVNDNSHDLFPCTNPVPTNKPGNIAYVIYTSGSSGRPKGVLVEHKSVVNTLVYRKEAYKLNANAICLQLFSYAFDGFVTSFFTPLVSGAKIVILNHNHAKDITKIVEAIVKHIVTHFISIPTLFQSIIRWLSPHDAANLKIVTLAGEILSPDIPAITKTKNEKIEIVNEYGVTEAAVLSTLYRNQEKGNEIKIGRPIWNTTVYIVRENNRLNPIGISGELCIGGIGTARGYLNNPELTCEKYIENPYQLHDRLYRTGDVARWLSSGDIELTGRIDQQVKIRGFRIELGEIKIKLSNHPDVKDVAVTIKEIKTGDKAICAYLVTGNASQIDKDFDAGKFRDYLAGELPDYMIPAYFMNIEKIPLTPNGKVDTKTLPGPLTINLSHHENYIPAKSEIEKDLAEIWEKVLGRAVGINENFFMMGGDSIKSIQVLSRMNQLGYKIEMKELFQSPTIAEMALKVKKFRNTSQQSTVAGKIPLIPVQQWFFSTHYRNIHHFNQSVMFHSKEPLEEEAVKTIFTKIQQHHDALRMTYKEENGQIIQINHDLDYPFSLKVFDFRTLENSKTEIETEATKIQSSIDLENGPLMKLGLFHRADDHFLLIVIHHLVVDAVSWRILFEDIETLYQQYISGESLTLPLKTDSFKVWAEKLSMYANSSTFLKEKSYWKQLLSTNVSPIPKDFEKIGNYRKDEESLSFTLDEQKTQKLLTKVNDAFATEINDILLTALAMGIKKNWKHDHVLISLEGHGREEIMADVDISRTIGWFTSTYPLVLNVSYENNLGRQIKEVKETIRKIPNRGIGYGILKYLSGKENKEDIRFQLNPQFSFNYLGQFDVDVSRMTFEIAEQSAGDALSPEGERESEFYISGMIANNRLILTITYNRNHYRHETISTLIGYIQTQLTHIIDYCITREKREQTPSDFTYKELSVETIDQLEKQYALEEIYTLTPMQEGMLFHALYDDSSSSYFEQTSYNLHGKLDPVIFEKSLSILFKRYDILRTAFIHDISDRPIQIVLENRDCDFYFKDIREIDGNEKKKAFVSAFKAQDKQRGFDLSRDVLMRVSVFRLDESEYEVTWSFHHILMDGWCIGILTSDFFEIYNSQIENRPIKLSPVKPFSMYIQWLQKQDHGVSQHYWRNYLYSYEGEATIPGAKEYQTSKKTLGYEIERVLLTLDREKTGCLNKIAGHNKVTLNIIVQVLWAVLLGKYNQKEDVVFGAVVSGRPFELEGVEAMVGLFINTIPIRICFDGNTTFKELFQMVQENAIASEPHHYYPLAEIQSATELKQDLINHLFIFENYPVAEQIEGMGNKNQQTTQVQFRLSGVDIFEQTNYNFNVIFSIGEELSGEFQYNGHVYNRDLVNRIKNHFLQLLKQVVNNDELQVSTLSLLSKEERKKILYNFNTTEVGYPAEKGIQQLLEEQVEKTPENIAITGPSLVDMEETHHEIKYSELNESADRLACLLQEKGVVPDTIVALKMERSVEMIIGILGILKAGGAYLPIDPNYPQERIDFMLEDSGANLLVTDNNLEKEGEMAGRNNALRNIQIVFLDILSLTSNRNSSPLSVRISQPAKFHLLQATGHQPPVTTLAYIIYTSGSTGKPKGVMVLHRSVVNILVALDREYPLKEADTYLFKTSYIFDVSVSELFGWFLGGGKLAILEKDGEKDPGKIIDTIWNKGVTHINFVPSMFNAFIEMVSPDNIIKLSGLKYIFLAGEALWPGLITKFRRFNTAIILENIYGPTEGTIYASKYPLSQWKDKSIPIGKPMQNVKLYVLDNNHRLLPIGVAGELCIGGAGVARGYLNNPELTAEKFRYDLWNYPGYHDKTCQHFCGEAREAVFSKSAPLTARGKWYHTGDLVEWLPDGNILFFGRLDHQVKIRGFRIELPEIENRLSLYPGVKEAVVVCRYDQQADKSLCAYFASNQELPESDLREYLLTYLPVYMVPAYFSRLEQIPRTSSGKIDRKMLPAPGIKTGKNNLIPRNQTEETLAGIWAEVLSLEKKQIGIDDNFFLLGGHSIKATIVMARIHKELDVKLPLVEIFKRKSIRELSQYIETTGKSKYQAIQPLEKREYYEASYGQKRVWLLSQTPETSMSFNMSGTYFFKSELNIEVLNRVLITLIQRHESLRTVFLFIDGEVKQGILSANEMKFSIDYRDFRVVKHNERTVIDLVEEGNNTPFDLLKGPLFRVIVVQLETKNYLLLFTMHHIISDFLSVDILTGEFLSLHESLLKGKKNPLSPLRIQYKEFAIWQNKLLHGQELERLRQYWHSRFNGKMPTLELPYDRPRPAIRSHKGGYVDLKISSDITSQLRTIAGENDATLFMVLFASVNVLLHFYTGQTNIIIGLPISGREHQDLENQIGFYLNTLALKTTFRETEIFIRLLEIVRKVTLEAYEHQMYPFDLLINDLKIKRESGRHPLFDVVVDMINLSKPLYSLDERSVEAVGSKDFTNNYKGRSKFDLAIYFFEGEKNINVTFEYDTDLFDRKTISRISKRYGKLLENIIRDPRLSISKLLLDDKISVPAFAPFTSG